MTRRLRSPFGVAWTAALAVVLAGTALRAQRNDGLYSLLRDDERAHNLNDARKRIAAGRIAEGIELLLDVLKTSPSVVISSGSYDNWIGLREAARNELAKLSPESAKLYERLVSGEAEPRLREAKLRDDPEELTAVATRYPHTTAARAARLAAGDRFLERGRVLRALREYSFVDATPTHGAAARIALCRSLLGLRVTPGSLDGVSLPFGEETLPAKTWLRRVGKLGDLGYSDSYWPAFGGGLDGTRLSPVPVDPEKLAWSKGLSDLAEDRYWQQNLFPVADGRHVFVNTGTKVYAFDLLSDQRNAWQSLSHMEAIDPGWTRDQFMVSLSPDYAQSAALGAGLVVAPLQVPIIPNIAKENQDFNHIPIMRRLPVRRLHAFDANTGKLVWSHYDPELSAKANRRSADAIDVSGPPLVVDDTVYVATHSQIGTIALYLSAFDLATGKRRWRTLICSSQTEVNMFGNVFREYAAGPLCYSGGAVFGSTNLGLAYSVRTDDGSIRWLQSYPVIEIPRARMRPEFRPVVWANNAPIASGGVVVMTPLDSYYAIALDTRTGHIRWKLLHQIRDGVHLSRGYGLRWLAGVHKGKAYFSGHAIVTRPLAARGRPEVLASPMKLGQSQGGDTIQRIPRPLICADRIYYLSSRGLVILDHNGNVQQGKRRWPEEAELGNLIASAGVLVSVRPRFIHAYYSLRELLTRARNDAAKEPRNPEPALTYAELFSVRQPATLADQELAVRLYRKVLALARGAGQGPGAPLVLRAKRGLYSKLRDLGSIQDLTNSEASRKYRSEAISVGTELFATGNLRERELVRYMVGLLDFYPDTGDPLRNRILTELERNHGDFVYAFGGSRKARVGLFVLGQRLAANAPPTRRLRVLRRILLEFGNDIVPFGPLKREPGRKFALREITTLIKSNGRSVYAPLEREAARMLAAAPDDPGRLQMILEQYPSSVTATKALVRLGVLAGKRGDFARALQAYAFGLTRLPALPADLCIAVARAADKSGNLAFARALRSRLEGGDKTPAPASVPRRIVSVTGKPRLVHVPALSTSRFRAMLQPVQQAGFAPVRTELPLWLLQRNGLFAYAHTAGGYSVRRPVWQTLYDPPIGPFEPALSGRVLVLPEEDGVRGLDAAKGHRIWGIKPGAVSTDTGRDTMLLGGPLTSGLYCICSGSPDFSKRKQLRLTGLEPLTGSVVFERTLEDSRLPALQGGHLFRYVRTRGRGVSKLVLLDPVDGTDELEIPLDGKVGPRLQTHAQRHVLVTHKELFLLVPAETATEEGDAGLYCFALTDRSRSRLRLDWPKRRWFRPIRGLQDGDSFLVAGREVLVSIGFHNSAVGRLWRIDRTTGRRRYDVGCGYNARFASHGYGSPAAARGPGPIVVIGEDQRRNARVTCVDTRPHGRSWAVTLTPNQLHVSPDLPPPAFTKDWVILGNPVRRGRNRYLDLLVLRLDSGEVVRTNDMRTKPWDEIAEIVPWDEQLILRSRNNAWILGGRIKAKGKTR